MRNHNSRLAKLEWKAGIGKQSLYLCFIPPDWLTWDTPAETTKGYKIQPCMTTAGGTGGEPFYLATRDDLDAFAARPDVNLTIIRAFGQETQEATNEQP